MAFHAHTAAARLTTASLTLGASSVASNEPMMPTERRRSPTAGRWCRRRLVRLDHGPNGLAIPRCVASPTTLSRSYGLFLD